MDWENYLAYILLASDMRANFLGAFPQRKKNKHKLKLKIAFDVEKREKETRLRQKVSISCMAFTYLAKA